MRQRGNTLIATMATLVIILILASATMFGSGILRGPGQAPTSSRKDGKGTTIPGAAKAAAQDAVTRSRLDQIRKGIEVYKLSNDDNPPASLAELKFPAEELLDGVGNEPFQYDPATSRVWSDHPGHEKY